MASHSVSGLGDPATSQQVDLDAVVTVMDMGVKFSYRIPTFSVVNVDLRQVKVQLHNDVKDTTTTVVDAFIRADSMLDQVKPPFCLSLTEFCFVPVEEFCKCVYVRHLKSLTSGLLVIWNWRDYTDETEIDEEKSSCGNITDTDFSEEECGQCEETSTVNFKCVGVTRDASYQDTLKKAYFAKRGGKSVSVRLTPQHHNPYDSHAVAFECQVEDGSWNVYGYVIKELCDNVLEAIRKNEIISVEFSWIKYKILRTTGAGYYTAVKVTKKNKWVKIVQTLSDTMFH